MRESLRLALTVAALGLMIFAVAACGGGAPAPTPVVVTATPALAAQAPAATAAPAAAATSGLLTAFLPTTAPTAVVAPTLPPQATATPSARTTPTASASIKAAATPGVKPGATAAAKSPLDDLPPDMLPTMMAMMPTAPPAPSGQAAGLSQTDLKGRWDGYVTIDAVKMAGGQSAEDQKQCDDMVAAIKGRQLPLGAEFDPKSASSGSYISIEKDMTSGTETKKTDKASTYSYSNNTIVVDESDETGKARFEGKTIKTSTGFAIVGTWKFDGRLDPSDTSAPQATITGVWILTK